MPPPMKHHEPPHPPQVSLHRARAVMPRRQCAAHVVQQICRTRSARTTLLCHANHAASRVPIITDIPEELLGAKQPAPRAFAMAQTRCRWPGIRAGTAISSHCAQRGLRTIGCRGPSGSGRTQRRERNSAGGKACGPGIGGKICYALRCDLSADKAAGVAVNCAGVGLEVWAR